MEPRNTDDAFGRALPPSLAAHAVVMILVALLFNVAQTLAGLCAVLQFLWMLILRERNVALAEFGDGLARWMATSARFLTGAADRRPFPWTSWR